MIEREGKRKRRAKEERIEKLLAAKDAKTLNERRRSYTQEKRCPGCDEVYQDPPNEDWIRCGSCEL
jgi:hypothetical protein